MTKDGGSERDDVPSADHVHSIPPSEVDRYHCSPCVPYARWALHRPTHGKPH